MSHFILLFALWTNVNQAEVVSCDDPEANSWFFMACVPSPAECYYSCPPRKGYKAERDPEVCSLPMADWACYCADSAD